MEEDNNFELGQHILPYPKHVASPKIEPKDLSVFKKIGANKVNKVLGDQYKDLIRLAETLQNSYIVNKDVYGSNYNFEPIIGEIYHLYEDSENRKFLSMINPEEWDKNYLYSVKLNYEMIWVQV